MKTSSRLTFVFRDIIHTSSCRGQCPRLLQPWQCPAQTAYQDFLVLANRMCHCSAAHYLPREKALKNAKLLEQYLKEYKVFLTLEMYMENQKERSQTFLSLYKSSVATTISTSEWQVSKIIYCILLSLEEGLRVYLGFRKCQRKILSLNKKRGKRHKRKNVTPKVAEFLSGVRK